MALAFIFRVPEAGVVAATARLLLVATHPTCYVIYPIAHARVPDMLS